MSSLALLVSVLPHVGGVETPTNFLSPTNVCNIADQSIVVTWDDMDNDPTGIFDFYYRSTNNRPDEVDPSMFGGTHIHNTTAMDATDQFTWDTGDVPSGAYYLYGVTTDPPLPQIFVYTRGVVTVRHPGDPLYPAVWVPEPDGFMDIVANEYELVWRACGTGPMTATLEYASVNPPGDPLKPIASGIAMTPAGDGSFDGSYTWDLSAFPEQSYFFVKVTVTDAAGRTHSAHSRSTLIIYRGPDGGPTDGDGGILEFPDAGPGMAEPPGCCSVAGRREQTPWVWTLIAALMTPLWRRTKCSRVYRS